MNVRPAAVIFRDSHDQPELLLMHYRYGSHDVYALPGGSPDRTETLPETLHRELHEELGVSVEINELILLGEMLLTERANDVLHVLFSAKLLHETPTLNPNETSALAVVWMPVAQLTAQNLYPNVGQSLRQWLDTGQAPGYIGRIAQRHFK